MAFGDDQFNILIKTTADTSGIQQTSKALDDLKAKAAAPIPKVSAAAELGGAIGSFAVGLGGALSALAPSLMAIYNGFNKLNAEQDKWVDDALKSAERAHEIALAFQDSVEWGRKFKQLLDSPLADRVGAISQALEVLKTEQKLAYESLALGSTTAMADIQKLQRQIDQLSGALKNATNEQNKFNEALAREASTFLPDAIKSSSAQTQAVLKNEQLAQEARQAGQDNMADQFQKTADQMKASMTPDQLAEYQGIMKAGTEPLGRRAGIGESQEILDQEALNQMNFTRQLQGLAPFTMQQAKEEASANKLVEAISKAFDGVMTKYWGP